MKCVVAFLSCLFLVFAFAEEKKSHSQPGLKVSVNSEKVNPNESVDHYPPKLLRGIRECEIKRIDINDPKGKEQEKAVAKYRAHLKKVNSAGSLRVSPYGINEDDLREIIKGKSGKGPIKLAVILNSAQYEKMKGEHESAEYYSVNRIFQENKKPIDKLLAKEEFKNVKIQFYPIYTVDKNRRLTFDPIKRIHYTKRSKEDPKVTISIEGYGQLTAAQMDPNNKKFQETIKNVDAFLVTKAGIPWNNFKGFAQSKLGKMLGEAYQNKKTLIFKSRLPISALPIKEYNQHPFYRRGNLAAFADVLQIENIGQSVHKIQEEMGPKETLSLIPTTGSLQLVGDNRYRFKHANGVIDYRPEMWLLIDGFLSTDFHNPNLVVRTQQERKGSFDPIDWKKTGFKPVKIAFSQTAGVTASHKPGLIQFSGTPVTAVNGEDQLQPRVYLYSGKPTKDCDVFYVRANATDILYDQNTGKFRAFKTSRKAAPKLAKYKKTVKPFDLAGLLLAHTTPEQFRRVLDLGVITSEQSKKILPYLWDISRAKNDVKNRNDGRNRGRLERAKLQLGKVLAQLKPKTKINRGKQFSEQAFRSMTPRQLLALSALGPLNASEKKRVFSNLKHLKESNENFQKENSRYAALQLAFNIIETSNSLVEIEMARLAPKLRQAWKTGDSKKTDAFLLRARKLDGQRKANLNRLAKYLEKMGLEE